MLHRISGWGRVPVAVADGDLPGTLHEALSALASPSLPRGLGRSYGDAALPAPGVRSLGTRRLDRILALDPDTGLLEAEGGASLRAILETAVPRGWFLPVTPGTQWVTLGGAVASNVHGKNHHRAGSIENFVTWMEVATPKGLFRCSPAEHPDLFRATVGGYGLTGLITRVALRMKPIRSTRLRVRSLRRPDLRGLFEAFREHDADHEYSVAWVDALAPGKRLGRGILHLGNHADDTARPATAAPGQRLPRPVLGIPFDVPSGLLVPRALRAFNAACYHAPRRESAHEEGYGRFFYPLDAISDWNRLYGSRGFFQYQCVIPDPRGEAGVETCLRHLEKHRMGSFLAVLKRCGDDTVALPFCRRGFTLALDIPHRGAETLRRLDELDGIVLEFGGRVYLTKDARLSRDAFRAMYPGWRDWMEAVRRYNPEGRGRSGMSERLGLWDA